MVAPDAYEEQEPEVLEIIESSPRSLNTVLAGIKKRWGISLSKSSLKNLCKKLKLSWKRVRKSLRGKRDDEAFAVVQEEIKLLLDRADKGEIDFFILMNQALLLILVFLMLGNRLESKLKHLAQGAIS